MSYYTERHGMRAPIEKTDVISYEMYSLLFDCCERYFDNIAWKYPDYCPDGNGCCGIDLNKLNSDLSFEIPGLFRGIGGWISKPQESFYHDKYDQYALLDFIEFMYDNVRDISKVHWHDYYKHDDLHFSNSRAVTHLFRKEINDIFRKTGLQYTLNEKGMVERVVDDDVLSCEVERHIEQIPEPGIKELLKEAVILYKSPAPQARQDAVEKIWDAFERLKSYYTTLDKKDSTTQVIDSIAGGKTEFVTLFDEEFRKLTKIGNDFRIRHHETNRIDITDARHYDYFFNRCLSLIALAIQYLH